MPKARFLASILLCLSACSTPVPAGDAGVDAFTPTADTGESASDAFTPADASAPDDAATPVDATTPIDAFMPIDSFAPDVGADAGVPALATWEASLDPSDVGERFGSALSLSADGSRALVSAPFGMGPSGASGSARVFVRDLGGAWTEEAILLASDAEADDRFGQAAALSGDGRRAIVGAQTDDTIAGADAGSARVFVRTGATWTQEAVLLAPDGAPNDRLGFSVSINSDGTVAVVGANYDDTAAGANAGSVRVFVRSGSTWTQEAALMAAGGAASDYLGSAVALSDDGGRLLAGAHGDDTLGGADAGSAMVFVRSGTSWSEEATLVASDGAAGDIFGYGLVSMSADGTRALVGAGQHDAAGGSDAGTAYVFLRTGTNWAEESALVARDGAALDNFGIGVSLNGDGDRAIIGANHDARAGFTDSGSAHLFIREGTRWVEMPPLFHPSPAMGDLFGSALAISADGRTAIVGAPWDDTTHGANAGSVHVFSVSP